MFLFGYHFNCMTLFAKSLSYGRTHVVGPDQTPRVVRSDYSLSTIFVANEHLQKTFFTLSVHKIMPKHYQKYVKTAGLW